MLLYPAQKLKFKHHYYTKETTRDQKTVRNRWKPTQSINQTKDLKKTKCLMPTYQLHYKSFLSLCMVSDGYLRKISGFWSPYFMCDWNLTLYQKKITFLVCGRKTGAIFLGWGVGGGDSLRSSFISGEWNIVFFFK